MATITHEDGSAVEPQEMYDAFMRGPVILEEQKSGSGTAQTVVAVDYGGTPDDVLYCDVTTSKNVTITLGIK